MAVTMCQPLHVVKRLMVEVVDRAAFWGLLLSLVHVAASGHWVGDGCSNAKDPWVIQDDRLFAAVRCCSRSFAACYSNSANACLPARANFSAASQICALQGERLCTKSELASNICCGTGCGYDTVLVWTSTEGTAHWMFSSGWQP
jgi:hypothetical protein